MRANMTLHGIQKNLTVQMQNVAMHGTMTGMQTRIRWMFWKQLQKPVERILLQKHFQILRHTLWQSADVLQETQIRVRTIYVRILTMHLQLIWQMSLNTGIKKVWSNSRVPIRWMSRQPATGEQTATNRKAAISARENHSRRFWLHWTKS